MKRILLAFVALLLILGVGCSSEENNNNQLKEETSNDQNEQNEENVKETDEKQETEATTKTSSDVAGVTDDLIVHYIDANQADATLFQYEYDGKPYTILFDAGDWNRKDVVNYLHSEEISSIDLVIISHPHADHIGQLAQIMDDFSVDEVWFSGNTASSGTYQQAAEAVLESDADYYEPRAGETFEIGSLGIEVLHPSTLTEELNEDSISVKMTYEDIAFIFTGDAYKNQELEMIKQTDDISANILQLGHHGSRTSSSKQFIEAVEPDVAIYSAGEGNSYGHPHMETIDLMQELEVDLYGTDVHGTIIVTTDGTTYDITPSSTGDIEAGESGGKEASDEKDQSTTDSNQSSSTSCININEASTDQLEEITHIGTERAKEIEKLRPFDSLDDLTKVNGIGPARIAEIIEEGKACIGGD